MSNDPFADPPQRHVAPLRVASSRDPLDSEPASGEGTRPSHHLESPITTPSKQLRKSQLPPLTDGVAHNRTTSSDPHALELSASRGTLPPHHGRSLSSDPLGVDSATGNSNSNGNISPSQHTGPTTPNGGGESPTTLSTEKRKSGWSLFKTADEKAADALRSDQTAARKVIESEEEKALKALRIEVGDSLVQISLAHKRLVRHSQELEGEWEKGAAALKKEMKVDLGTIEAEFKAKTKELRKK